MDVTAAISRIAAIQQMLQQVAPVAAPTPTARASAVPASAVTPVAGTFQSQYASALAVPAATAPAGPSGDLGVPSPYDDMFRRASQITGVPAALIKAVARAESSFNPQSDSAAGAQGLMQLMPATARALGVQDPYDPWQAILGGAKYLKTHLDQFGDGVLAAAAYNAGGGAVSRYGGVPPYAETEGYVEKIRQYVAEYGGVDIPMTGIRR